MLTRRELVLRCMTGEPVDRLPVSPRCWEFCTAHYGASNVATMGQSAGQSAWDNHPCTANRLPET